MDDTLYFIIVNGVALSIACMVVWLLKQFVLGMKFVMKVMFILEDRADILEKAKEKME